MAKQKIQNGQAEYGVVHVMEEEMRAAEQGVFEPKSGEAGQRRSRKAEPAAVENKDEGAAPTNKSATRTTAEPSVRVTRRKAPAKK